MMTWMLMATRKKKMLITLTIDCAVLLLHAVYRMKTNKTPRLDAGGRWFWPPGKDFQLLAIVICSTFSWLVLVRRSCFDSCWYDFAGFALL
jgi:hypothetical protein